jgi:hypothetical protein
MRNSFLVAFAIFALMECPAKADTITYELFDATASFSTGATSFTINIDGTFTYDTTSRAVSS